MNKVMKTFIIKVLNVYMNINVYMCISACVRLKLKRSDHVFFIRITRQELLQNSRQ